MELNVLFMKESSKWLAQGVQLDIAAQGESFEDAHRAFEFALISELTFAQETGKSTELAHLPSAPPYVWKLFNQCSQPVTKKQDAPFRVPEELRKLIQNILPQNQEMRVALW